MEKNPLQGIRVLDFTWLLAGPYATRIMGDFGAEVIKVQSVKTAHGAESNATPYFNAWNRNKLSITLDLSRCEGRELALRLVRISDVVMENFTPRVMANWGLNYEALKQIRPDLIMAGLSGMGQTGPWRDFAALGYTLQALTGLTSLTSPENHSPAGIGYAYADPLAGLIAALAILGALEHRRKTGQGQYLDISEYEAISSLLGPALLDCAVNHPPAVTPDKTSAEIPAAPYGCYRCLGDDRWCVIAAFSENEWHALCRVMGNPAWTKQGRFSNLPQRQQHAEALHELIGQWAINYPPEKLMVMLQEAGVPAGVV
ncbi:MAG: CoA transferase, partial [Syntrophales bacterium]|nr:CoA transferase [Syntrophales bacterium]